MTRLLRLSQLCLLGAGIFLTVLLFDTHAHQTFREPKISMMLALGGTILLFWGLANLAAGFRRTPFWLPPAPTLALIPLAGILIARLVADAGPSETSLLSSLGSLPLKIHYRFYVIAPVVAWFLFFSAASKTFVTGRSKSYLVLCLFCAAGLETLVVLSEVLGNLIGKQLTPVTWRAEVDLMGQVVKEAIYGTIGNPNFVSGYLAISGVALLGLFFATSNRILRAATGGLIAAMLLCIVAARSKGGLVAFTVGVAHFALVYRFVLSRAAESSWMGSRVRKALPVGFVILLVLVVGVGWFLADQSANPNEVPYLDRWLETLTLRGDSIAVRALLADSGFRMWEGSRWLGLGPGEFKVEFLDTLRTMVTGPDADLYAGRVARLHSLRATHLHNEYLQVLVEWGIVGIVFVELFLVWCMVLAVDAMRHSTSAMDRWLRLGFLSAFWAGLGGCLVDLPLHRPAQASLLAILLGASIACPRRVDPLFRSGLAWLRIPGGVMLSAVCLCAGVWLLWDSMARYVSLREIRYARAVLSGEIAGGDVRKSMEVVKRAISRVPGEGDYAFYLAGAQAGYDPQGAVELIRRIRPISDHPDLSFVEARAQVERNNFSAAEPLLDFLTILDRDHPGLHYLRGRVYEATGRPEKARSAYLTEVHWSEGQAGRPPGDQPQQTRERRVDRDLIDTYQRLAQLLENNQDYDLAVTYYRKFIDALAGQTPSYPLAQLRLAYLYRDRYYDYDLAEKYFLEAFEILKKTGNDQEARRIESELGNLAKARSSSR